MRIQNAFVKKQLLHQIINFHYFYGEDTEMIAILKFSVQYLNFTDLHHQTEVVTETVPCCHHLSQGHAHSAGPQM